MDTDDVPVEHGENASESAVQSLLLLSSTHSQKSSPGDDDEKKENGGSPAGITTNSASSSSRRVGIPEDNTFPSFSGMLPLPLSMEAFVNGAAGLSNNGFVVVPQHFVTNGGMNNHPPGFFIPIHSSFGSAAIGQSSLLLQRSLSSEVGEYMMPNRPTISSSSSSSSSGAAAAASGGAPMEKKLVLFEGLKAMQAREYPVNEMLFARSLALQYHDSSSGGPPCNVPPPDGSIDNLPVGHLDFLVQQQQLQQQFQQEQLQQQPPQSQPPQPQLFMHQNQMQSRAHATHDDASGNNSMSTTSSSKKRLNSGTSSVQSFEYGAGAADASGMGKKHRGSDLSLGSLNFSGKSFTSLSSGFHMGTNMNFFPEGVTMYDPLGQGGTGMFALDPRSSGISGSMSLGGSLGGLSDSTKPLGSGGVGLMLPPMPPGDRGMTLNLPSLAQSRTSQAAAASSSSSSSHAGTTKMLSFGPTNGRKNEHDANGMGSASAAGAGDNNDAMGTSKLKHPKSSAERYRQRNSRRKQSFSSKLARVVSMLRLWVKRVGGVHTEAAGTSSSSSSNGTGGTGADVTTGPLAGGGGSSSSGGDMHLSSSVPMMSSRPDIPPPGGSGGNSESSKSNLI